MSITMFRRDHSRRSESDGDEVRWDFLSCSERSPRTSITGKNKIVSPLQRTSVDLLGFRQHPGMHL